jgi:hypothetical protein
MDHDDLDISDRLAALEARAPAPAMPRALPPRRRRGRIALSLAMAPVLALALVASATGAIVVSNLVRGYPGIQDPGQPLAGAHMECMTPPEADAFLSAHGFRNVIWQVEAGDPSSRTADGRYTTTQVQQAVPPEHGFVIPGPFHDGTVIMVIDQRVGATGVGDCYASPMP